ncbi:hypothetical protein GXM_00301 [Nostoc sphaeroides CCNUC1]|uniref:Uncharacterized protein n=1 Tax=Nostoc sphaeroides CCNUC1 TaxID=2653204 RepID=A0A5P8VQV2_9NOSO|nr:hypothetical protein GXM_00301 [Nostoc sphaeroides CCNUC1]
MVIAQNLELSEDLNILADRYYLLYKGFIFKNSRKPKSTHEQNYSTQ